MRVTYLGRGARNYQEQPVRSAPRRSWEFQCVIRGQCAPLIPGSDPVFASRRLWAFPPGYVHGWTSVRSCAVLVFHLDRVAGVFKEALPADGYLETNLLDADVKALELLMDALESAREASGGIHPLLVRWTESQLVWIALRSQMSRVSSRQDHALELCARAKGWLDAEMSGGAGVNEIAAAVGVSSCHLRRVFMDAEGVSPREALARARVDRACRLIAYGETDMQQVADSCGLGSLQAFSRFFKQHTGKSPRHWRAALGPANPDRKSHS